MGFSHCSVNRELIVWWGNNCAAQTTGKCVCALKIYLVSCACSPMAHSSARPSIRPTLLPLYSPQYLMDPVYICYSLSRNMISIEYEISMSYCSDPGALYNIMNTHWKVFESPFSMDWHTAHNISWILFTFSRATRSTKWNVNVFNSVRCIRIYFHHICYLVSISYICDFLCEIDSDLDSGSLNRLLSEFMFAKWKTVVT